MMILLRNSELEFWVGNYESRKIPRHGREVVAVEEGGSQQNHVKFPLNSNSNSNSNSDSLRFSDLYDDN